MRPSKRDIKKPARFKDQDQTIEQSPATKLASKRRRGRGEKTPGSSSRTDDESQLQSQSGVQKTN